MLLWLMEAVVIEYLEKRSYFFIWEDKVLTQQDLHIAENKDKIKHHYVSALWEVC